MAFMIRYKSMDHLSRHFRYRRTRASAIVSSAIFPNLCLLFIHLLRISSTSFCRFTLFNTFLPPSLSRLYNTFFTGKATNSLFKKKEGEGALKLLKKNSLKKKSPTSFLVQERNTAERILIGRDTSDLTGKTLSRRRIVDELRTRDRENPPDRLAEICVYFAYNTRVFNFRETALAFRAPLFTRVFKIPPLCWFDAGRRGTAEASFNWNSRLLFISKERAVEINARKFLAVNSSPKTTGKERKP